MFADGLKNLVSELVNSRSVSATERVQSARLSAHSMRQIYRSGIGNKIARIKSGYSMRDALVFEQSGDEKYYSIAAEVAVKKAAMWMVAFGRGVIVLHYRGDDLSSEYDQRNDEMPMLSVFSGDMISAIDVSIDLQDPRYYMPGTYLIRGVRVHHTRVVDFMYVSPPEYDAPYYNYGGISEYELIYDQLIADSVVQRASPRIIDKASTLFYKVRGFKDALRVGDEKNIIEYFTRLEDVRGIYAAGLIDSEDELEVVSQTLTNLSDADQITLRRLAMVSGIPLTVLVGESAHGLNATGDNEQQIFWDMISSLQSDYLLAPINELMRKLGRGSAWFSDNLGDTPEGRVRYEGLALDNALKLWQMGEDYVDYLLDRGIIKRDNYLELFSGQNDTSS